jgi:AraC-like DNA-binding protein
MSQSDWIHAQGVSLQTLFRDDCVEIVRWRCSAEAAGSTARMRRAWYILSFTHSGTFVVHSRDQARIIDATRAMVIRPEEPFSMTRCNESKATGGAVAIRPDLFREIGGSDDDSVACSGIPASVFLLQHLLLRCAEASGDPALTETALWIAGETLRARPESPRHGSSPTETTVDVQTLLAAKLTEPLRLADIARAVHRSPSHLCRTFRHETGLRMRRYLQRLRICASVNDVIDRRTNLSALAQTLGYTSHSHFDAAFRMELRVTPAELRRIAVLPRLTQMRHALHSSSPNCK